VCSHLRDEWWYCWREGSISRMVVAVPCATVVY
jgi:hypothetical protein